MKKYIVHEEVNLVQADKRCKRWMKKGVELKVLPSDGSEIPFC